MNCVVLGGGGFLGTHLCRALKAAGHRVRVYERQAPPQAWTVDVDWITGDFASERAKGSVLKQCDVLFHLICTTLPASSNQDPSFDVQSNLVATIHWLDAALAANVRKIVFPSSGGAVCGIPQIIPIPETHQTEPICSYGITKLAIEKYLHLYCRLHGLDATVLRLANPFGEGQYSDRPHGAVGVFLQKALRNHSIEIWGDGSVVRDFIYVSDVADALLMAMEFSGPSAVLNIGSGIGTSLNMLLQEIERLLGRPVARRYAEARSFDPPVNVLNITKAITLTSWRPRTSLREGLGSMSNLPIVAER